MSEDELTADKTAVLETPARLGYNLLRISPLRILVLWAGFPYVFQAALLAVFIAMAVLSWNLYPPEGVPDKVFAKSHLVNLVVCKTGVKFGTDLVQQDRVNHMVEKGIHLDDLAVDGTVALDALVEFLGNRVHLRSSRS